MLHIASWIRATTILTFLISGCVATQAHEFEIDGIYSCSYTPVTEDYNALNSTIRDDETSNILFFDVVDGGNCVARALGTSARIGVEYRLPSGFSVGESHMGFDLI